MNYDKGKRMVLTEHYSPINREEFLFVLNKMKEGAELIEKMNEKNKSK
jgi:hypothetical protein